MKVGFLRCFWFLLMNINQDKMNMVPQLTRVCSCQTAGSTEVFLLLKMEHPSQAFKVSRSDYNDAFLRGFMSLQSHSGLFIGMIYDVFILSFTFLTYPDNNWMKNYPCWSLTFSICKMGFIKQFFLSCEMGSTQINVHEQTLWRGSLLLQEILVWKNLL